MKYSECSSSKAGGNLGWFPRGKMEGKFQEQAFGSPPGACSEPYVLWVVCGQGGAQGG